MDTKIVVTPKEFDELKRLGAIEETLSGKDALEKYKTILGESRFALAETAKETGGTCKVEVDWSKQ